MEYEKMKKYQSLVAVILLLLVIFIRMPIVVVAIFLWIIIFIISNQLCKNILFSFFISSLFLVLYLMFCYKTGQTEQIESFEGVNDMVVENPKDDNPEATNFVDNPIAETFNKNDGVIMTEQPINLEDKKEENKISMMDSTNNVEKDAFDLDPKAFEDSDEDSDKDEKEDNMEVGISKVSSKEAYKAQKQLYDLTVATSKLGKQLENLSKPLKNGQKIIENLNKVGLGKFI
jgi:hypothetical protein